MQQNPALGWPCWAPKLYPWRHDSCSGVQQAKGRPVELKQPHQVEKAVASFYFSEIGMLGTKLEKTVKSLLILFITSSMMGVG